MKKIFLCLSGMILMGIGMTSCTKEETFSNGNPVFTATFENDAKTTIGGTDTTVLSWAGDESIKIYTRHSRTDYFATYITNSTGSYATFTHNSGSTLPEGAETYKAVYPAEYASNEVEGNRHKMKIILPATQDYTSPGIIQTFPMYAESSNTNFEFKNLCGVLRLHLSNLEKSVRSIAITASSPLKGTFTIDYNSGNPTIAHTGNSSDNSVTLNCGSDGVSIAGTTGAYFHIYLPPATYTSFTIQINFTDNTSSTKSLNNGASFTIVRNTRYTLTLYNPTTTTSGFSVSSTTHVTFAPGNLQYCPNYGSPSAGRYRFAEHQWDYVGGHTYGSTTHVGNVDGSTNNNITTSDYTGWIDLFGWGTGNDPTTHSHFADGATSHAYGTFTDWGANQIYYGETGESDAANTWRTLSSAEWDYLFHTRANASSKYGYATVNGVHGIVILPDTWNGSTITATNSGAGTWSDNTYDSDEWAAMEANGAAFLPAAGARLYTNDGHLFVGSVGSHAYYWSNTEHSDGNHAYNIYVEGDATSINSFTTQNTNSRYAGLSVRLAKNVD